MRPARRSWGICVVLGVAAIAACVSSPQLASWLQAVVTVDYSSHDFGTLSIGQGSSFGPITVSPQSKPDDDYITSITFDSTCPDFHIMAGPPLGSGSNGGAYGSAHVYYDCGVTVGSSGSSTDVMFGGQSYGSGSDCTAVTYQFGTSFAPSQPGHQTCVVRIHTISGSGGSDEDQLVTLMGSGSASNYALSVTPVTPPPMDFGTVATGTTSPARKVTITNTGGSPLNVSMLAPGMPFAVAPVANPVTLQPNASQIYMVTCSPSTIGVHTDSMTFTSAAPTASVMMTCTGVMTTLSFDKNPIDFGDLLVGQSPVTQTLTITNTGVTPVFLTQYAFGTGTDPNISYAPAPMQVDLQQGSATMVTVQYNPLTESSSGSLGSVAFLANSQPMTVPITGTALIGSIGADPASVDFGTICAGVSASQDVMITTNAAATVHVSAMTPPGSPFTASTTGLPTDLRGHGLDTITVTTGVMATAAGDVTDKFTLATNIPGMAMHDVPLHALVLTGGTAPTPDALHFGAVATGTTAPGKEVTFTNCGTDPVMITGSHLTGANATEFIVVPPQPQTLNPAQSVMFVVSMLPLTNGTKSATMVIDYDTGSSPVALDGEGTGGTAGGGKDRETYYACSSGGPVAMWPIGLALLALRRRRR